MCIRDRFHGAAVLHGHGPGEAGAVQVADGGADKGADLGGLLGGDVYKRQQISGTPAEHT